MTALLRRNGWERNDRPVEEVEECTDVTGCSRAGRWTHREVDGLYCAQHAAMASRERRWT